MSVADPLRQVGSSIQGAGRAVGWAALGMFVGRVLGLFVPDAAVDDSTLGYLGTTLMFALQNLGALGRIRTAKGRSLDDTLSDIDTIFAEGKITDVERVEMRRIALDTWARDGARSGKRTPKTA